MTYHVWKEQKKLRYGYTTGTCAMVAAGEAAMRLLLGIRRESVSVCLQNNICFEIPIHEVSGDMMSGNEISEKKVSETFSEMWLGCMVKKDSGDDPDVTDGMEVYAYVGKSNHKITREEAKENRHFFYEGGEFTLSLSGGEGIGIVTRKGLQQEIGYPAINEGPRRQIFEAVAFACRQADYRGSLEIHLVMPEGKGLAERTFNPGLGIVGGLSVLGTTGLLEPMSEKALIDTIEVEMKAALASGGKTLLVTPGNYGQEYVQDYFGLSLDFAVKCSNYIGEAIDLAVSLGAEGLLLVGDLGKLVKLAAGIFMTHSKQADGRMEILGVHAALAGADAEKVQQIMECLTTTEALQKLEAFGLLSVVMQSVLDKIGAHVKKRGGGLSIGVGVFSREYGMLGSVGDVEELAEAIRKSTAMEQEKEERRKPEREQGEKR